MGQPAASLKLHGTILGTHRRQFLNGWTVKSDRMLGPTVCMCPDGWWGALTLLTASKGPPRTHASALGGIYLWSPPSGSQGDASLFSWEMTSQVAELPSTAPGY